MKNIQRLTSTYTYPARGKGSPAIEVGFFLDSRLDRFNNVLRRVNITDKYGQIHSIDYSGKSLMLSVKTGARTTSVRRATREDLIKYKEAYFSYLSELSDEDKALHTDKIYLFLEELPPVESVEEKAKKEELEKAKNQELVEAKAELEALRAELQKAKAKPEKAKAVAKAEKEPEKSE
jgi:hypothetical protein